MAIFPMLARASYLPTNNSNVGIGTFSANDRLIVTGGNVGIGSLAPGQVMDVTGTVRATSFIGDGSGLTNVTVSSGWTLGASNVGISTTNNVGIGTNLTTTAGLTVLNGGVGIGTWNPGYDITIVPQSSSGGFQITESDEPTKSAIIMSTGTTSGAINVLNNNATKVLLTANNGTSYFNNSNQNLGIGTTIPIGGLSVMSGNVGIGTWIPAYDLDIANEAPIVRFGSSNGASGGRFTTNISGATAYAYRFFSNDFANLLLSMYAGGNIGISTDAPGALLDVNSTASQDLFRVLDGGASDGTQFIIDQNGNVGIGTFRPDTSTGLFIYNTLTTPGLEFVKNGGAETDPIFYFWGNATGNIRRTSNRLTLLRNGNLGVGTFSPSALLEISSTASQDLFRINDNGVGDLSPAIFVDSVGNVGIGTLQTDGSQLSLPSTVLLGTQSSSVNQIYFANSATDAMFYLKNNLFSITHPTNGVNSLTFDMNTGNMGVGTFTANAILDISSTAAQDLFRVNDNALGDTTPFVVDSVGNVGVGTIRPGKLVEIIGNVGIGTTADRYTLSVNNAMVYQSVYDNGNSSTAATINWNNGSNQKITLTGNCTFTFTAPTSGVARLLLELDQDGTGSRTVTWPATVKWPGGAAPTLTTTASAIDFVSCFYNGTNYYCQDSLNFQ